MGRKFPFWRRILFRSNLFPIWARGLSFTTGVFRLAANSLMGSELALKKTWLFRGFVGDELHYPVVWGLVHKPWNLRIPSLNNQDDSMESCSPWVFCALEKQQRPNTVMLTWRIIPGWSEWLGSWSPPFLGSMNFGHVRKGSITMVIYHVSPTSNGFPGGLKAVPRLGAGMAASCGNDASQGKSKGDQTPAIGPWGREM